ncbi:DUF2971 domain-containing protein [Leptospira bouyouniensis]|uniref:DUF2971 domain-containing protein n=1 Tax=Leptospira bouyouniensis TaxID=2484911 RepID=UPI0010915B54|nr:DUF2971 domain-containing protein [Leptospira bouyouniensis]TGM85096.1 DUF2971 domain-containing protein [Leptospira bouyouniensis]
MGLDLHAQNIINGTNDQFLFRFEKYETNRLETVLNSKLFFNNINVFNDPYEFTHFPIAKTSSNLLAYKNELENAGISLEGIDWKTFLLSKNDDSDFLLENIKALSNEYTIVCFSKTWDEHLLWSHYTQGHTGICYVYGFDFFITEDQRAVIEVGNKLQASLFDVIYSNVWPEFFKEQEEISGRILYTKSLVWEYEKEVRMILRGGSGLQAIPKETLKAVIFGMKFKESEIPEVKNRFHSNGFTLDFYSIKMKLGSYELGLEKI